MFTFHLQTYFSGFYDIGIGESSTLKVVYLICIYISHIQIVLYMKLKMNFDLSKTPHDIKNRYIS
jgi:hypothetical protein